MEMNLQRGEVADKPGFAALREAARSVFEDLDQPSEFKRRLMRLIENAMGDNLDEADVRDVVRLVVVPEPGEA